MIQLIVNETDFENVRQVAKHCSYDALKPYIRERQNIDLIDLLGRAFYFDVVKNKTEANYVELLDGSEYTDCNKHEVQHFGLKRVLIHYAYASYVIEHGYTDTAFGVVQKLGEDSVPVPMVELRNLHDRNRRLAYDYFKMTKDFLCNNKDKFALFNKDCSDCLCTDKLNPIETRTSTFRVVRKNR
jgi:hypothetical protein